MTEFCPDCGEEYGDCKCGKKDVEKPGGQTQLNDGGVGLFDKIIAIAEKASEQPIASQNPVNIEIKNLVVSQLPATQIALGTSNDLKDYIQAKKPNVEFIVWNEEEITLLMADRNNEISFKPEIHPASALFFKNESKRIRQSFFDEGIRVWEGECEPVQFTKRRLLQFLRRYGLKSDTELEKAIKEMKVTETFKQESIMLDDDSDNERRIEEETEETTLPKKFKMLFPLFEGQYGELSFEARVIKLKEDWGKDTPRRGIEIRCVNAREVRQGMMKSALDKLPADIPRYYGSAQIKRG